MNPLNPTDQECSDILITAFDGDYGGCWYWAMPDPEVRVSEQFVMDGPKVDDLWRAVGIADKEEQERRYRVDHETIRVGLRRIVEGDCTFGGKPWENRTHILGSLSDPGDIDADIADVIVQAGLFGDIVYG
jgi:hypothetical protein